MKGSIGDRATEKPYMPRFQHQLLMSKTLRASINLAPPLLQVLIWFSKLDGVRPK